MKVFLLRNESVSREKWIYLSEDGCFSVGSHAFAVREAWNLGSMPKSLCLLGDWVALRAAHESRTKGHEKWWFGGMEIYGSSKNLLEQHASKKYKLRAFGLSRPSAVSLRSAVPLRSFATLNGYTVV